MERIAGPGATPDNLFTEGDPSLGIDATTVTANWLNGAQEELVGIIEAAGLTPNGANNGQVLAALKGWINPSLYVDEDFGDYSASGVVQFGDAGLITIPVAGWYHIRTNFLVAVNTAGNGNLHYQKEDGSPLIPGFVGVGGASSAFSSYTEFSGYFQATAGQKIKVYATLSNAAIDTLYLQLMRLPFIPD